MRRRAPFVLILLAGVAVCLLLWETVIGPALQEASPDDEASMIGTGGPLPRAGRARADR